MNEKTKQDLAKKKFSRIEFFIEYLEQCKALQNGEVKNEDYIAALTKFYDDSFYDGCTYVLEVYVASMFHDLDFYYGQFENLGNTAEE